jgi:hypothetical protein
MTTSSNSPGYRKKPLWIYIAAIILMITPFGNLLYSLAALGVSQWYLPTTWTFWTQFVSLSTWFLLGIIFSSGVLLLVVRRWTWTLSLVFLSIIVVYDFIMLATNQFEIMGPFPIFLMIMATIAFGLGLYLSEFRKPYLNPRLRWWETEPRYRVDLPVTLTTVEHPGNLVDISRSGVLIEWADAKAVPEIEGNLNLTLPTQISIPVVVSRRTARGYGLQFTSLTSSQKKDLKIFIETLTIDPTKLIR